LMIELATSSSEISISNRFVVFLLFPTPLSSRRVVSCWRRWSVGWNGRHPSFPFRHVLVCMLAAATQATSKAFTLFEITLRELQNA
jgi:hypothetical protein